MKKKKRNTFKRLRDEDKYERRRGCKHRWKLVAPYTWSCVKCGAYKDEKQITGK